MDVRSDRVRVPLAVDLDGTLIAGDLLWEGLFALLRANPLYLFLAPFWALMGAARLKHEISSRVAIDAESLPYRAGFVDRLRAEKAAGRTLVLATAASRRYADAVAAHLGLFDRVLSSDETTNLKSARKRDALIALYGDGGFDYAGNDRADLALFDAAANAVVVGPDKAARDWAGRHNAEIVDDRKVTMKTVFKMLRVHQWLKNVLIVAPMALNHEYLVPAMLLSCAIAFVSFSSAASAIYIVNDFFDLTLDRRHRTKRNRPLASGAISLQTGALAAVGLLAISVLTALALPIEFLGVLALYLVMTTAYSLSLKRMLLVDVLTLAGLYTVRILAGAAATGVEVSFWLLAFSIFFFLSLSLVKRFVELDGTQTPVGAKLAGRGYRPEDLDIVAQAGVASAFSAALVIALYLNSPDVLEMYAHPWLVWPLGPIILYLTLRIWVLARRKEMHDDPVVFLIGDWRSLAVVAFGAALVFLAR